MRSYPNPCCIPKARFLLLFAIPSATAFSRFHQFTASQGSPSRTRTTFYQTSSPLRTSPTSFHRTLPARCAALKASSDNTMTYMDAISQAASKALGRDVTMQPASGGGFSGGGGASTSAVTDGTTKYFCKAASDKDMLFAEYTGVKEMADTQTIKVPTPIAYGEYQNRAFVLFEYLDFTSGGSQYALGQKLAELHKSCSSNGKFGFQIDNTIGATFQPNGWMDTWDEFWDTHRLGHMLKLTNNAGFSNDKIETLRSKTKELLSHNPQHLWGGNKGFCKDATGSVVPCIFDPATYYGDREADVAMTYVFGGFTNEFYEGYDSVWPLPAGHEQRRTVYNLYHILNHEVLFGGGYLSQARGMIEKILRS